MKRVLLWTAGIVGLLVLSVGIVIVAGLIDGAVLSLFVWAVAIWRMLRWSAPKQSKGQRLLWTAGIVGLVGFIVAIAIVHAIQNFELFTPDPRSDVSPAWTPDGKHIVFSSWFDYRAALYEIDADGQNERQLTDDGQVVAPAVSPDGRRIAFTGHRSGYGPDLYVARADGSNAQRLGAHTRLAESAPAWSPDGVRLAFSRHAVTEYRESEWLFVARADGNGRGLRLVQSDDDSYLEADPSWSANGRFIAYAGTGGIYVIPSTGGKPRLVAGGLLETPAWAPHTNRIAAVHNDTIRILRLRGRDRARTIRAFEFSGLYEVGDIAWEPHERKIAFSGYADDLDGGARCLFVLDLRDGSLTALTDPVPQCLRVALVRS